MDAITEIKKQLGSEALIIGAEKSLKALRAGTLAKVFLATNPRQGVRDDIDRYAKLGDAEVILLEVPNDELGTMCKKPFPISVIGLKRQ
ncbi:ribosomal L7Ae/L30e/S12e/Gadd45 family protein [Candidatus Woesearchaeota archaeon]|nr:ribosomal L7Ae/L30e/S12e/Gadd45 family protein [Candidatus Woesearchaeota archaeon]